MLCEIFVGLIMQYHYVGFDKIPVGDSRVGHNVPNVTGENVQPATNCTTADNTLDGAIIEEGDEHRRRISGALASMMCVENSESFRETICVAPAEGKKPLSFMTDPNFETMCNPDKFPFGNGTFSSERPRKLKYFNQRLLDVDGKFA